MPVISNQTALAVNEVLVSLIKVRRPVMGTQKMRRIVRAVVAQLGDYDAHRQELLALHGARDEDGKLKEEHSHVVFADDAAKAAFAAGFAELLLATGGEIEALTVRDFGPLTADGSDWLHGEQAPTPEQALALGDLLEEPAPEKG